MRGHTAGSIRGVLAGMAALAVALLAHAGPATLPEPLTLQAALAAVAPDHPDLARAGADSARARAERDAAEARYGLGATLEVEARYIDPSPLAPDPAHDDSRASLVLRKRLHDFGQTAALREAGEARVGGSAERARAALQARRLDVIGRFFDVLLADLAFRVQDEAMAIAYVRLDRARDRHELGQVSDIELLEFETRYQEVREARFAAQARQRVSRVRLAEALGRPGALPSVLVEPDLSPLLARPLPDTEAMMAEVIAASPELRALHAELAAAEARRQAALAQGRPVVRGEVGAYEYSRDFGSRDRWRAGIILEWPFYSGGRRQAGTAAAQAEYDRLAAGLRARESALRVRVAELVERLAVLRAARDAAQTRSDYRELYLDRSRALYEMEVATDLGDAMVLSTEARLRQAEADYAYWLAWAELDALRGRLGEEP